MDLLFEDIFRESVFVKKLILFGCYLLLKCVYCVVNVSGYVMPKVRMLFVCIGNNTEFN